MKPRHLVWVLICALLSVYPLSIGPVCAWYLRNAGLTDYREILEFYAPILWLSDRVPPFKFAVDHYVQLWIDVER